MLPKFSMFELACILKYILKKDYTIILKEIVGKNKAASCRVIKI